MKNIVSTCWPFDHDNLTVEDVLSHLVILGVTEVCIRTPVYYEHYDSPADPTYHDRLAAGARALGIDVSLWVPISLVYPARQAQAIHREYDRYKPSRIILDAERKWVNLYGANTRPFLLALGKMLCPIGLGSYRRPFLQPQIRWQAWLTTRSGGDYVISFQAAQLYPIGWLQPASVVRQFRMDIDSHEEQHRLAGRPDISWLPFLPAFAEGLDPYGDLWYPRADAMKAAVDYMKTRLASRLIGINWWSLDQDLVSNSKLKPLYDYIRGFDSPPPPPSHTATARPGYSNIRTGPGTSFPTTGMYLSGGNRVTIVLLQVGWAKISPTENRWVALSRLIED